MGLIYRNNICYSGGGGSYQELTQAEYDALTQEEKMNGTIYFVTDANPSGGGAAYDDTALSARVTAVENLTSGLTQLTVTMVDGNDVAHTYKILGQEVVAP